MYLQYRYSLEPSRAQYARLRQILALQRNLYNAALENRRDALQAGKKLTIEDDCVSLGRYRRTYPEQAALPWSVNHWTLRRLDATMTVYARRLGAGEEAGLPRYRSEARWRSFGVYGLKGWNLRSDRLCLDGICGTIRIRMHRPLPPGAKPIGLTLTREARRWFVTILIAVDAGVEHPNHSSACGVEVSSTGLVTLSDGVQFPAVAPSPENAGNLRRTRRALTRSQRDSRRHRKVLDRLARAHRAIRNARSNHAHQVSSAIVKRHAFIAMKEPMQEATSIGPNKVSMGKYDAVCRGGNNHSLTGSNYGSLIEKVRYKAEKAGGVMITVDPRQSVEECHSCGITAQKIDGDGWHCSACGTNIHLGHNAALDILARGLAAHAAATGRRVGKILPNASFQAGRSPRNTASAA